jgi:hypothetical protein
MSKKQKKLSPIAVYENFESLKSELLSFVLVSGKVVLGRIEKINENKFFIRNTMRHKLILPLQDISEIWQEVKVTE